MRNALSSLQYNPQDKEKVDNIINKFNTTVNDFIERGDLENRVLDTKTLINDLTSKEGLSAIQTRLSK